MKLSKALKEKNKLIGKIKDLEEKLIQHNSYVEGNKVIYYTENIFSELLDKKEELCKLKSAIFKANFKVYDKITLLSEHKSTIKNLKNMSTKEGIIYERYSNNEGIKYFSQIGALAVEKMVLDLEDKIDILQTDLEEHNAITSIEL